MILFEGLVKPAMCGSDRLAVSNLILSPGPPCVPDWGQEYDGVHVVEEGVPKQLHQGQRFSMTSSTSK